jgi:MFS family permease
LDGPVYFSNWILDAAISSGMVSLYPYRLSVTIRIVRGFSVPAILLFSLSAGVVVDRFPKKRMVCLTQIGFMLQSFFLALVVWTGHAKYWHVLMLAVVYGCLQSLDVPARHSWFIEMVGKEDLPNAVSLNSSVVTMGKIIGPVIAGLVIANYGIASCFFINGLSFVTVLIGIFLIQNQGAPKANQEKNMFLEVKQGIAYILQSEMLSSILLVMTIYCTLAMNVSVIIPIFSDTVLGLGVNGYTSLLSATGVGAFIGAVYMAQNKMLHIKFLFLNAVITSLILIMAAFTTFYPLNCLLMGFVGFLNIAFMNRANANLQLNSNDGFRGRIMSIYNLVNHGSTPLGNTITGAAMEFGGAAMGFIFCGLSTLFFIIVLTLRYKESLKIQHKIAQ